MKKLFIFFGILFLVSGCDNSETKTLSCSSTNDQNGITTKTRYDFKYLNDEVKYVTITYDYIRNDKNDAVDGIDVCGRYGWQGASARQESDCSS